MKQMFLTKELTAKLLENGAASNKGETDPYPVVKFFTPDAQATWLLSEIYPDNPDIAFGLCDLGMGCPELGTVSLSELKSLKGLLGLPVERDYYFKADKPLSAYAAAADAAGYIKT